MNAKKLKTELGKIVTEMTDLEVRMAQHSFYNNGATTFDVARWVTDSTKLSSRLDKIWKSLK